MKQPRKIIFFISVIFILFFRITFAESADINTKLKVLYEAPPPVASDGGGIPSLVGISQLRIIDFKIDAKTTSSDFKVELSNPAKLFVYIGETPELEMGIVYSGDTSDNHSFLLTDLVPNKKYYYKIEVFDNAVSKISTGIKSFFTSGLSTNISEQTNVSDINIRTLGNGLQLSWQGVGVDEESYFRILRSYKFYPNDPYDGVPVYEGLGTNFIDTNLVDNTKYYYTIFTCGVDGFCSSGASVSYFFGGSAVVDDTDTSSTTVDNLKPLLIKEIIIFENGEQVIPKLDVYSLEGEGQIKLIVRPQDKILSDIRAVSMEVFLDGKSVIRHLAKYNREKEYFETSGFFLTSNDRYEVKVNVFGLNKEIIFQKKLFLDYSAQRLVDYKIACFYNLRSFIFCYWWLILLIIIAMFIFRSFVKNI